MLRRPRCVLRRERVRGEPWRRRSRKPRRRLQRDIAATSEDSSGDTDPHFSYCYEANDAGYGSYVEGEDPEYDWYDDNDNDGTSASSKWAGCSRCAWLRAYESQRRPAGCGLMSGQDGASSCRRWWNRRLNGCWALHLLPVRLAVTTSTAGRVVLLRA